MRKDFTPSERVAIGAAIEAELQGRQLATLKQNTVPENFPERDALPHGDTRDLVAKATGFGNGKTLEADEHHERIFSPSTKAPRGAFLLAAM